MGGVGKALFGSKSKTKTQTAPSILPEQRELLNILIKELQPELERLAGTARVPGLDPATQTSLAGLEELAMGIVGGDRPGAETADVGAGALKQAIGRGPIDFEEFFQETVAKPSFEQFFEETIPTIGRNFSRGGSNQFFGGERRMAEGNAREDLIESLTRERARLAFETDTQFQENLIKAALASPSVAGAQSQIGTSVPAAVLGGIAGVGELGRGPAKEQVIQQNELARILAGLASFSGQDTNFTTTPGTAGILAQMLASAGGGFAGSFGAGGGSAASTAIFG